MYYEGDILQFCERSENLIRLLIRARRYDEPDFLGKQQLASWDIPVDEPRESTRLEYLRRARRAYERICDYIEDDSLVADDSNIPPEDRSAEWLVYELVHVEPLNTAIAAKDTPIDWESVFQRKALPIIRRKLDDRVKVQNEATLTANNGVDTPILSRTEREILVAMLELDATTSDKRQPADVIAKTALGVDNASSIKDDMVVLRKDKKLIATKKGRGGGSWLTANGIARANSLRAP